MPATIVVNDSDCIAKREYFAEGDLAPAFTLRFSRPYRDESGDFRVDIQFLGACEEKSIFAMGIDDVNALDLAFWLAGTIISIVSAEQYGGRLRWAGASEGKPIGLPVMPGMHKDFRNY